jgi:hypothetical protein
VGYTKKKGGGTIVISPQQSCVYSRTFNSVTYLCLFTFSINCSGKSASTLYTFHRDSQFTKFYVSRLTFRLVVGD